MQIDVVYCPLRLKINCLLSTPSQFAKCVRSCSAARASVLPRKDIAKVKMSTRHLDSPMAADI